MKKNKWGIFFSIFIIFIFNDLEGQIIIQEKAEAMHVRPKSQQEWFFLNRHLPKKTIKPYIEFDFSPSERWNLPPPYQEKKERPGAVLNWGFHF